MACKYATKSNGFFMCNKLCDECMFDIPDDLKCESMYGIVSMENKNHENEFIFEDELQIKDEEGDF